MDNSPDNNGPRRNHRERKRTTFYSPEAPKKRTSFAERFKVFAASPEGKDFLRATSLSNAPPARTFDDLLGALIDPENSPFTGETLTQMATPAAIALLTEMLTEHRTRSTSVSALTFDAQKAAVAAALEKLHQAADGPSLAQLEGAAAKRQAPLTKELPKQKTFDEVLEAAMTGNKETPLNTIATPAHARTLEAIVRTARAAMPFDMSSWTPQLLRSTCLAELDRLAPGFTSPSLEQLTAAGHTKPPQKGKAPKSKDAPTADSVDAFLLGLNDPHLANVCRDTLDQHNSGDDEDPQPIVRQRVVPKQVEYAISPSLHRRTGLTKLRAWNLPKNLVRQELAAFVFGPDGTSLGAFDPDLEKCLKDVIKGFKHDPVLRDHHEIVGTTYKHAIVIYDAAVAKLDVSKGLCAFPPAQYDDLIVLHLEYCTGYLTMTQRSGTLTWGEIFMILFADYSKWATLPEATIDNVMCALKARNKFSTPITYNGKTPLNIPQLAAPAPQAATIPNQDKAGTKTPQLPKGNVLVPGKTPPTWKEIVDGKMCANCYGTGHAGPACPVKCARAACHPPHTARFIYHARKDCKVVLK